MYSSIIADLGAARYFAGRGRKWSEFIAPPEVVFVRSVKTEVRRRKRPSKVASERASERVNGHYAATIASLSTVCNVTCLRG